MPKPYVRHNGTICAIKVFRQVADHFIGTQGRFPMTYAGRRYGGWRYWCLICNAYEWSGRDVGTAMDGARKHLRIKHAGQVIAHA